MKGKKRVVPGGLRGTLERRNHGCKAVLTAQKSAEAIVPWGKIPQGKGGTNTSRSKRRKEDCMKNAENTGRCPQRDSTECKGYAGAQSAVQLGSGETAGRGQKLLETILYKDNMNNAYKRVKASKGKEGLFIRVHPKALLKAKNNLRA